MSKALSLLLGSLFVIVPVGILIELIIYGPVRDFPASLTELILMTILFVIIGLFIAAAIVVSHWKEIKE